MELLRIPRKLQHLRFVQTWGCRNNIYQLGKHFVVESTEIQSCFANTLLQSHGITEGNREQRNRNIKSRDADVRV